LRSLKWYRSLLSDSKVRQQEGFFLVEGFRAAEQIIKEFPESIDEILGTENTVAVYRKDFPTRILSQSQLDYISSLRSPQGIVAVVKLPPECYTPEIPQEYGTAILLLEHVQDPGNVGTLIRTAAAFNYSGVLLSSQCADPFSSKVVQASAGSILSVWIRRTDSYLQMVSQLKAEGLMILAADVHGQQHLDITGRDHILALGNEGAGLSSELLGISDYSFRIPFNSKKVESLNVAVSGAIAMFCMKYQI